MTNVFLKHYPVSTGIGNHPPILGHDCYACFSTCRSLNYHVCASLSFSDSFGMPQTISDVAGRMEKISEVLISYIFN